MQGGGYVTGAGALYLWKPCGKWVLNRQHLCNLIEKAAAYGLRERFALARRHPIGRAMFAVGRFARRFNLNQSSAEGYALGGMVAGSLSKLEQIGMRGAEFELARAKAGMTRGLGQGQGTPQNTSYQSIRSLSSALGISPSSHVNMSKQVGTAHRVN